ncbi:Calpain-5 [Dirofilaria immitis]
MLLAFSYIISILFELINRTISATDKTDPPISNLSQGLIFPREVLLFTAVSFYIPRASFLRIRYMNRSLCSLNAMGNAIFPCRCFGFPSDHYELIIDNTPILKFSVIVDKKFWKIPENPIICQPLVIEFDSNILCNELNLSLLLQYAPSTVNDRKIDNLKFKNETEMPLEKKVIVNCRYLCFPGIYRITVINSGWMIQYRFDINVDDSEVRFALTQKVEDECKKNREPLMTIGMHLMKVEDNRIYRVHQAINSEVISDYNYGRSVYLHCQNLRRGRYILLPTTFAPREFAKFLLRIYSKRNIAPRVLNRDVPSRGLCFCKKVNSVARLTVVGAKISSENEAIRTYIVISSDKERVQTRIIEGTKVSWNQSFIFYRRDMTHEFLIELIEDRIMRDRTLGAVNIVENVSNDTRSLECDIIAEDHSIGTLSIIIQSYDDPVYL